MLVFENNHIYIHNISNVSERMDNVDKTTLFGEFESPAHKPSEHTQLKQSPGARVEKEPAQSEELETEAIEKTLKLRIIQV